MRISHLNRQRNTVGDSGRPIDIEFTGPLILSGDPTEGVDAATKQYVDNRFLSLSASDLKSGILPIGRLPAFSGDLTNVAGSNVFTLNPTGVTSGTYRKVTVDAKGRVIGSSALGASDIPPLDWTKITKNKPTTLAGYGITDGINLTGDTIVGTLKSNATPTAAMHAVTRGYIETAASGAGGLVSPGIIIGFPTTTTPGGYLRCNGGEVSKTTYAALYSVVGDLFGSDLTPGSGKPWKQQYAFNTEQSSDITGWVADANLPGTLHASQAIVTKNRVYLLGGYNGNNYVSTVYTAPINEDGTLGTWTTGTNLPGVLYHSQAIVTKNRVYLLGGWIGGGAVATVYTAPINEDGTLGTWTTGTSLPEPVRWSQAIVTKNRVYLLGGGNSSGSVSTVYTAPINADGTLGAWITGTSLPGVLSGSQAIVTKNRVYLLGGWNGSYLSTVYTAPINADGTLGIWTTGPSLPGALYSSQAIVTKNRVYLLGGNSSDPVSRLEVYTAPINSDGTIGVWVTGTSLPGVLGYSQAVVTKNRVYLLGGYSNSGTVSTVYTAPFSGGLNDYSSFYDGSIAAITDSTKFRLPDYTSRESTAERYYIKY